MRETSLKFTVALYCYLHTSISQIIDVTISPNASVGTDVHNGQCSLMASEILSNISSLSSVTLNASITEDTIDVWIGVFVRYTKWISFDGCYKYSNESGAGFIFSGNPTKKCYERCKEKYGRFYLTNKKCFCEGVEKSRPDTCYSVKCTEESTCTELCGEKLATDESGVCACQYSIHNHRHDNIGSEENCMTISVNGSKLTISAKKCDTKFSYICINEEMTSIKCVSTEVNWYEARLKCEDNYKLATLIPPNLYSDIPINVPAWVSLFRIPILEFEESNPDSDGIDCLSVTLYKNGSYKTRVRSCSESLPLLCKIDIETMPTMSSETDMNFKMWIVAVIALFLLAAVFVVCIIYKKKKNVVEISISVSTVDKTENREYTEIDDNVFEASRGKPGINETKFAYSQGDDRVYNTLQKNKDQNPSKNVYNHTNDRTYNRLPDVKSCNHNEYDNIQDFKTDGSYGRFRKDANSEKPPLVDGAYDTMSTIFSENFK